MAKTIDEIAKKIGVSITTVNLVINGNANKYRISEKTQKKINDYIDEYGVMINQTARNLKLKKTNTIGLVVPRLTNVFYSSLTEWLEKSCNAEGYQLISVCSDSDNEKERQVIQNLISRGVDGLFVVSCSRLQQLQSIHDSKNKPIVFLDRDFKVEGQSTVVTDNYLGFFDLSKIIIKKSIADVYAIFGDSELPSIRDRVKGFVDAHKDLGKVLNEGCIHTVPHNRVQDGFSAMETIMFELKATPKAIVFSSLPILEGALHFLKLHYGAIPNNIVIGTFDDHSMLEFLSNPTVSVKQNAELLASSAGSLLFSFLKNKVVKPTNIVIKPTVISRN